MTPADVVVIVLGVALIAGTLWFFLVPPKRASLMAKERAQEIRVLVKGGYEPAIIPVEVGRPVRLEFYRDETAECSEHLLFDTLGIEERLEPYTTTIVEFTPTTPGDYRFRCANFEMQGRVVAQVGREAARVNLGRGHSKHG